MATGVLSATGLAVFCELEDAAKRRPCLLRKGPRRRLVLVFPFQHESDAVLMTVPSPRDPSVSNAHS